MCKKSKMDHLLKNEVYDGFDNNLGTRYTSPQLKKIRSVQSNHSLSDNRFIASSNMCCPSSILQL